MFNDKTKNDDIKVIEDYIKLVKFMNHKNIVVTSHGVVLFLLMHKKKLMILKFLWMLNFIWLMKN